MKRMIITTTFEIWMTISRSVCRFKNSHHLWSAVTVGHHNNAVWWWGVGDYLTKKAFYFGRVGGCLIRFKNSHDVCVQSLKNNYYTINVLCSVTTKQHWALRADGYGGGGKLRSRSYIRQYYNNKILYSVGSSSVFVGVVNIINTDDDDGASERGGREVMCR